MPWNYALHQINRSFEQLAQWYHEFILRSEASFQALHKRIEYLEKQQAQQNDEQIERILRKILAEKFGDPSVLPTSSSDRLRNNDSHPQRPEEDVYIPKYVSIDTSKLHVEPDAVPSKEYGRTFAMLEDKLQGFPHLNEAEGKGSS